MSSLLSNVFRFAVRKASAKNATMSLAERRIALEKSATRFKLPANIEIEKIKIGEIEAEWVKPANSTSGKTILYFHGGSYVQGSASTHRSLVAALVQATAGRLLVPNYRLAPEHPFPAALEDASSCYSWLLEQKIPPTSLLIAGDSAGGGLAVATLLALRDQNGKLPAGAICISPWLDLTNQSASHHRNARREPSLRTVLLNEAARQYAAKTMLTDPLVSPLYGNLTGLPPLFIQVGSDEILLDDAVLFAEKARTANVEVTLEVHQQMWHLWQIFGKRMKESRQAIESIGRFSTSLT
jgi:epsilon-lactone hydrolase